VRRREKLGCIVSGAKVMATLVDASGT